jgi:hypothetical protein
LIVNLVVNPRVMKVREVEPREVLGWLEALTPT